MRDVLRLILVLTLVCISTAALLAGVNVATEARIEEAERREKEAAIGEVLPGMANNPAQDTLRVNIEGEDVLFHVGRDSEENALGYALECMSPEGYSGDITLMLGADRDGGVIGVRTLRHSETPGLGAKITSVDFWGQFLGKRLDSFDFRVKTYGGDVDAITGATISSRAVSEAIRTGLEKVAAIGGQ